MVSDNIHGRTHTRDNSKLLFIKRAEAAAIADAAAERKIMMMLPPCAKLYYTRLTKILDHM